MNFAIFVQNSIYVTLDLFSTATTSKLQQHQTQNMNWFTSVTSRHFNNISTYVSKIIVFAFKLNCFCNESLHKWCRHFLSKEKFFSLCRELHAKGCLIRFFYFKANWYWTLKQSVKSVLREFKEILITFILFFNVIALTLLPTSSSICRESKPEAGKSWAFCPNHWTTSTLINSLLKSHTQMVLALANDSQTGGRYPFKDCQIACKGHQSLPGCSYYLRLIVVCSILGLLKFKITVKPVYAGHPWDLKKVAVVQRFRHRWPLFTVYYYTNFGKLGLKLAVVDRWPLFRGGR